MELNDYNFCDELANPYVVKCVLLGHYGVGKSTLGHKFLQKTSKYFLNDIIEPTIGIDFIPKTIKLPKYNDHKIKLQIWDTAGQEKFKSIVKSYLRNVYVAYIMFDITNRESWNEIDTWKDILDKLNNNFNNLDNSDNSDNSSLNDKNSKKIPKLVLVGTKSDKPNHTITESEIKLKSKEWNCNYYILSSKEEDSYITIYNMFLQETSDFHKDIVWKYKNNKELPYGVLTKDVKKYILNGDDNYQSNKTNKYKWCCFQ